MRKGIIRFCCLVLCILFFSLNSHAETARATSMGIITGGPQGTYFQFGLNLKQLMEKNGIDLTVSNSNGSVSNVFAVYKKPNTQMGIVQSDVLAFVAKIESDPVLKRIAKKIKMVYPLYNEEIHLVGIKEIASFDELEGKRVAIGKEGSGTYLTAKLLFKVSGIQPDELVTIGATEALKQLKAGRVDAMFYVAGYPVKLFSEQVSELDSLAIIPIENKAIVDFYPESTIPASTYAWQPEAIHSVAVKSVLVSFNFRNAHCKNVGRFAYQLKENLEWLKQNGHPKWNSVDLEYPLKGWQQYDCVQNFHLNKKEPKVEKFEENNPILKAIKEML